jgi:sugar/nucleoside kinase (ribokinase family)
VVTAAVRDRLAELSDRDPDRFVLADSRERIALFRNVYTKPNLAECAFAIRLLQGLVNDGWLEGVVLSISLAIETNRPVFCTGGSDGIWIGRSPAADAKPCTVHVPAYPVQGPIDVCGAGDSCSAGITCAMTAGATPEQAAAFGNLVASITIQQIGVTGTATPGQVRARWKEVG